MRPRNCLAGRDLRVASWRSRIISGRVGVRPFVARNSSNSTRNAPWTWVARVENSASNTSSTPSISNPADRRGPLSRKLQVAPVSRATASAMRQSYTSLTATVAA